MSDLPPVITSSAQPAPVDGLIAAFMKLGLVSEEIADTIWLALEIQQYESPYSPGENAVSQPDKLAHEGIDSVKPIDDSFNPIDPVKPIDPVEPIDSATNLNTSTASSSDSPKQAEVIPAGEQTSGDRNLAIRLPDARSLPEPLALARALRPLFLRVPSANLVLDEAATIDRIAEEQLWTAVLKPDLEPWLELALVVDESPSMLLWQRTIRELQGLLEGYGIFRDVRTWGMIIEPVVDRNGITEQQVRLRPGIGKVARDRRTRSPGELLDPQGRRLIMIATDCVAPHWHDGTMLSTLKTWSQSSSTAIIQMLPEWLWSRTALGRAAPVRFRSLFPGLSSNCLQAKPLSSWDEIDFEKGIKVPIVTLEPEIFTTWSQLVAGKGGVWAPGFVFEPEFFDDDEEDSTDDDLSVEQGVEEDSTDDDLSVEQGVEEDSTDDDLSAEQQVSEFYHSASPMAWRLVSLLAAAPVICLPVVRIIQRELLPKSRQVHVAEVFLGGLIGPSQPLSEINQDTDPDTIHYGIENDVRTVLLESSLRSDSVNVLEVVSQFVDSQIGRSVANFVAYLRDPDRVKNGEIQSSSIATITAEILKQLGGEYTRYAEQLEDGEESSPVKDAAILEMDLSNKNLTSIPPEIFDLTNLISLNLSNNYIAEIPTAIGNLTNLTSLDLRNNRIAIIPEALNKLTNLTTLWLDRNRIAIIPDALANLTNLTTLWLNRNQINEIPQWLQEFKNLEKLDLRGNPLPIPREILGTKEYSEDPGDLQAILSFYFQTQDPNAVEPLYEAKFIIVGEGAAGKTSLAKKLTDPDYVLNSDEKSTQGLDVIQWDFIQPNGKPFRVNIWDFGGQDIYFGTYQFFMTNRALYAFVIDNRRGNPNFYYWLNLVRLYSNDSPIFIVKNEKGDRNCELEEQQLRSEFLQLKGSLPTNLSTNRGLSEIQHFIQTHIANLPHIQLPIPKTWVKIRNVLENYAQSRNYISIEEYHKLGKQNGVKDAQERLNISQYLHDLGICLHFQKDSTLKHRVILKPSWATNAVYKVTDTRTIFQNKGRFTTTDLQTIWGDSEYADMQDELLKLMQNFKICYPLGKDTYIAPILLPFEQPAYTWDETDNLTLRYEYEFMPKGILTRFIIEMHDKIEDLPAPAPANSQLVWKNGVILTNGSARAEIIEDSDNRNIRIRIIGFGKQSFLAIVRDEFQKIHNSYDRLKYKKLVPCNCIQCKDIEHYAYTYALEDLEERLRNGMSKVECNNSYLEVDVRRLIGGTIENLTQTTAEIQALLDTLSEIYNPTTPAGQEKIGKEAIESIKQNPELKDRITKAIEQGGYADLEAAIDQPILKEYLAKHTGSRRSPEAPTPRSNVYNHSTYHINMSGDTIQNAYGSGDNVAEDKVMGDKIDTQINNSQNLAQAAAEIKALLDQFSEAHNPTTPAGQKKISQEVIESIEQNSTLKERITKAIKEGGYAALEAAIDRPIGKVCMAAFKGFVDGNLSIIYQNVEELNQALTLEQQSIEIYRAIGNRQGEAASLHQMSSIYESLGELNQALTLEQQSIEILRAIGDRQGEAASLHQMSRIYQNLGELNQALTLEQQSIEILRAIGDRQGEAASLHQMSIIYESLGELDQALTLGQQSIEIYREMGNRQGEAACLYQLSIIYRNLKELDKALSYSQQSIEICREIKDRNGEGTSLHQLSIIHSKLKNFEQALSYSEQAIEISREFGNLIGEAGCLHQMSIIYNESGKFEQALSLSEQSIEIRREIGNRQGEAASLHQMSMIHRNLNEFDKALDYSEQSLDIHREISNRPGEAHSLFHIATIYKGLKNLDKARSFFQQSQAIYREIGNSEKEKTCRNQLMNIYRKLNENK
jgi:tetratricopeptide (TPR) repeat protein/GTPase SAR1 family protein